MSSFLPFLPDDNALELGLDAVPIATLNAVSGNVAALRGMLALAAPAAAPSPPSMASLLAGSAAASPLPAGRNLFGAADPPSDAPFMYPLLLHQHHPPQQQPQQRPDAAGGIAPFSVPPSPAGSDEAPSSALAGRGFHVYKDNATPRTRVVLSRAAAGMVEEIIGEAVGRRRSAGIAY